VPGDYDITFYINNPNASNATQDETVSVEWIQPAININLVSQDNDIFVLDEASYNFNVTNGSGNYYVSVIPVGGNLGSTLEINGTSTGWGTGNAVSTGTNFEILLTPTQVGNAQFTVHVEDSGTGISADYNIMLNSNVPEFTLQNVYLTSTTIWSDETTTMHVEVNTNGYNHPIDYTYEYGISGNMSSSVVTGPPGAQNLTIDPDGAIGNLTALLTVTNQYGFDRTYNINFTSNDIMFNFNQISLDRGTGSQTIEIDVDDHNWVHFYTNPVLTFNDFTPGKYSINNVTINYNWYNGSDFGNSCGSGEDTQANKIINQVSSVYASNVNINANITKTAPTCTQGSNVRTDNTNYYWWNYNNYNGKQMLKNLDYITPGYTPTITITMTNTNGNSLQRIYSLSNGWTSYNSN